VIWNTPPDSYDTDDGTIEIYDGTWSRREYYFIFCCECRRKTRSQYLSDRILHCANTFHFPYHVIRYAFNMFVTTNLQKSI